MPLNVERSWMGVKFVQINGFNYIWCFLDKIISTLKMKYWTLKSSSSLSGQERRYCRCCLVRHCSIWFPIPSYQWPIPTYLCQCPVFLETTVWVWGADPYWWCSAGSVKSTGWLPASPPPMSLPTCKYKMKNERNAEKRQRQIGLPWQYNWKYPVDARTLCKFLSANNNHFTILSGGKSFDLNLFPAPSKGGLLWCFVSVMKTAD